MNDSKRRTSGLDSLPPVAGNGLLDRRALLGRGIAIAGATAAGASLTGAAAEPLKDDPWSGHQGSNVPELETRSRYEDKVRRILSNPNGEPRTQHARTPHQMLNGTITPNPLHFVDHSQRHPGHRSRQASAGDPRAREAADGVHARQARALPDGHAHGLR